MTQKQKIDRIAAILRNYHSDIQFKINSWDSYQLAEKITKWISNFYHIKERQTGSVDNVKREEDILREIQNFLQYHPIYAEHEFDPETMAQAIIEIADSFGGGGPPDDPTSIILSKIETETNQLWQRSVINLTIMGLLFTAYGSILLPLLTATGDAYAKLMPGNHFFAALTSLTGAAFSLIWILIGKGGYYWYRKYDKLLEKLQSAAYKTKEGYSFTKLPPLDDVDDCVFSTLPGRYSITRSQIVIGQILLTIWAIALITHCIQFAVNGGWDWIKNFWDCSKWISTLLGLGVALGMLYCFCWKITCSLKFPWNEDKEPPQTIGNRFKRFFCIKPKEK